MRTLAELRVADLAARAEVRRLQLFHHDPDQNDDDIDAVIESAAKEAKAAAPPTKPFPLGDEAKKAGVQYQHVVNNLKQRVELDYQYQPTGQHLAKLDHNLAIQGLLQTVEPVVLD